MNTTILYYPTINIPTQPWFRHALLYWDEVSSIVPQNQTDELSPDIQYLKEEGLFKTIEPETLIYQPSALQQLQDEFKEVVLSQPFQESRGSHSNKLVRIHKDKVSDSISDFLEEKNLAKQPKHSEWMQCDRHAFLLYMSLLAKHLAGIHSGNTTIGTDNAAYESLNFQRVDTGIPVVSLNLNDILPAPQENVPFEKIVDFKRKRKDHLENFQILLSEFHTQIATSASIPEMQEQAVAFQKALKNGVQELKTVLKDENIECVYNSLNSLIFSGITGFLEDNPYKVAVGVIDIGLQFISTRNKKREALENSPVSYLYYATKNQII
jgi:hypothetical protein